MTAYYNEFDPKAAAWLRELIKRGLIAPGEVDERSIKDVRAGDLAGFSQHHFFAGIGVWSYALRKAGWADDRPVWTGSCPCQPFSAAGKRGGTDDHRHLWPEFFRLIAECRPVTVFGEQVASKDGLSWLDSVHADLEGAGYAIGAVDSCSAGFGAPHSRQRLYFVADASMCGCREGKFEPPKTWAQEKPEFDRESLVKSEGHSVACGMAYSDGGNSGAEGLQRGREHGLQSKDRGPCNGFWGSAEWIPCREGKYRPIEPSTFPLVNGAPARLGRLRGYGNALVAPQAQAFIESYMEVLDAADSTAR